MRPSFDITSIKVEIKIYPENPLLDPKRIVYTLEESGYPEVKADILEIKPDLREYTGVKMKEWILRTWRN
jgi:hypothetical protein